MSANLSDNAYEVLKRRYLIKDETGKPTETVDQMWRRIAKAVASAEEGIITDMTLQKLRSSYYEMISNLDFLPNSPTIMNAGRPLGQLSACFVLPVEDSMEGIFNSIKNAALIHKSGGGTGFSFSRLRPEGSVVKSTGGIASGPISFMKAFDAATEAVKQGGCFVGETKVMTKNGPVEIKDLHEGMEVLTTLGYYPCTNPFITKTETEVWSMSVRDFNDNEFTVIATPDHPMLTGITEDGYTYTKMCDLAYGDTVINNCCYDGSYDYAEVISVVPKVAKRDVWNVEVPEVHNYFVCDSNGNGVFVSNTRRGANMGILQVDHPDIMKFITVKNDLHTLNNFNISVAITDKFMEAVKNKTTYELIDPHTEQVVGTLDANTVFNTIVESAWKTGEPGIVFIDRVNRDNTLIDVYGEIESMNPCGEQPLLPYEACNLGSINLVNHLKPVRGKGNLAIGAYEIDWDKLSNTVKLATRFLDDVITINNYPLEEIDTLTKASRKIGLGVMGFADALAMMNVPYDSEYAINLASSIMNSITSVSHKESNRLATMFGAYPAWYTCSKLAPDGVELPYVRNNTTTTIAPTGTLSIIADVSSGIEPFFSLAYYRNVMDGTKLPYVNNTLLQKLEWWLSDDSKNYLVDLIIKNGGTLHNIMNHPEYDPSKIKLIHNGFSVKRFISTLENIFKCAHDITPADHIKMQAAFQAYVDNAISKTINFSNSATKDDVYEAYMLAYNTGCKGTTIYRDGCRENQVLNTTTSEPPKHDTLEVQNMNYPENFYEVPAERRILYLDQIAHNQQYLSEIRSKISDSEGKHTGYPESFYDLPDDVRKRYTDQMLNIKASANDKKVIHNRVITASVTPEERPEEVSGFTKKIQIGCGKLYVTVNHDENGKICEVFTNNGKSGGCPSQSEATTRLVSIALRAGVDINEIIKQLRGIRCPSCQRNGNVKVLSCPDAIGRMLQEAKNRIDLSKNINTAYVDMRINNNKVEVAGIDYDIEDVSDDVCCNVGEEPKEQTAYEKTLYEFYSKEILDMGSGIEDPSALKFSKVCPECGAPLEHEGGCVTCRNCGWSKCN